MRDPDFALGFDGPEPVLIPRYDIIHQGGLELQYVWGSTLLKAESFVCGGQGARIELEGGALIAIDDDDDALYTLRRDSYLQLKLQHCF